MIGIELVFSKDKIISEFFELFKTPWEYIKPNRTYAVIISDQAQPSMLEARLVIIIHRGEDSTSEKAGAKPSKSILLRSGDTTFPIYLGIRKIMDGSPLINIEKTGECVGSYICNKGKIILHLGYDYFEEACYQLLSRSLYSRLFQIHKSVLYRRSFK